MWPRKPVQAQDTAIRDLFLKMGGAEDDPVLLRSMASSHEWAADFYAFLILLLNRKRKAYEAAPGVDSEAWSLRQRDLNAQIRLLKTLIHTSAYAQRMLDTKKPPEEGKEPDPEWWET